MIFIPGLPGTRAGIHEVIAPGKKRTLSHLKLHTLRFYHIAPKFSQRNQVVGMYKKSLCECWLTEVNIPNTARTMPYHIQLHDGAVIAPCSTLRIKLGYAELYYHTILLVDQLLT
jgi:hypothetical protein